MPYQATVYNIMIASPSDVEEERKIIREVISEWNTIHSKPRKIVLLPRGWETDSVPKINNSHPQDLINQQVLQDSDLLVGIFWTRIGTARQTDTTTIGTARQTDTTIQQKQEVYPSGTVEEIERHIENHTGKKPALLYFSGKPLPQNFDPKQWKRLQQFKSSCQSRGLYQTYSNTQLFKELFSRHLQQLLNNDEYFKNKSTTDSTTQPSVPKSSSSDEVVIEEKLPHSNTKPSVPESSPPEVSIEEKLPRSKIDTAKLYSQLKTITSWILDITKIILSYFFALFSFLLRNPVYIFIALILILTSTPKIWRDISLAFSVKTFRDKLSNGSLGPEMVWISTGTSQSVKKFAIGKYEITRGNFREFVNATGYKIDAEQYKCHYTNNFGKYEGIEKNWENIDGQDDLPVVCVSWDDAKQYASWLSNQTKTKYKLPSEEQWVYAARAGTTATYFWGSELGKGCEYANISTCGNQDSILPVGSFKANKFGLHDITGNVWEWVESATNNGCALRGGSRFNQWIKKLSLDYKGSSTLDGPCTSKLAFYDVGFRVARVAVEE